MNCNEVSKHVQFSYGSRFTVNISLIALLTCNNDSPWFINLGLTYNQINNNLLSQAATMDTHGLPNDVLSNLDPIAIIIIIPICDLLVSIIELSLLP